MSESGYQVKKHCFAYVQRKKIVGGISRMVDCCRVCKEVYCASERCPFYKPRDVWQKELIAAHGTYDLNEIFREYELKKTGASKR